MSFSRRHFLQGLGTALALPALEFFGTAQAATAPKRAVFLYLPNGAQWRPAATGRGYVLPEALQALAPVRDYVTVVSGLSLPAANVGRPGGHARAGGAFLTCARPEFPGPAVGRSIDQVLAETLGKSTRHGSLTIGTEAGNGSDNGYSPQYQNNISWLSPNTPNSKESNPQAVFERLFGGGSASDRSARQGQQDAHGKSILDFALGEAKALNAKLGAADRQKLAAYLQSVRELETRMGEGGSAACTSVAVPTGTDAYKTKVDVFYDLLYHALACDLTRVATYLLANEGSNISYDFIGVNGGHHEISHDGSAGGKAKIAKIAAWHVSRFAAFLSRLKDTKEAGGTMLDNTVLLFGSGFGDGSRHTHEDLPIIIAGRSPGRISGGQHIDVGQKSIANAYLTMAAAVDVPLTTFADGTTPLKL